MLYLLSVGFCVPELVLPELVAEYLTLRLHAEEVLPDQWLFASDLRAEQIAEDLLPLLDSANDSLLITEIRANHVLHNVGIDAPDLRLLLQAVEQSRQIPPTP